MQAFVFLLTDSQGSLCLSSSSEHFGQFVQGFWVAGIVLSSLDPGALTQRAILAAGEAWCCYLCWACGLNPGLTRHASSAAKLLVGGIGYALQGGVSSSPTEVE